MTSKSGNKYSDDKHAHSGSEGDAPFTKYSLRSKGKGKGVASVGSSQDSYTHKHGSGYGDRSLKNAYGGGDNYSGRSSYRSSFYDSDGDGYPTSSHHSSRSKHPSSSGKSRSDLSHGDSSYDSEGSRTTHRTCHPGDDLSVGRHHKDSGQSHRRSSSRHRSSKSTCSSSKVHSGALLSSPDSFRRIPESSTPTCRGPRDRDEDSPPPPYSTQPSSGSTSGDRKRRDELRKFEMIEVNEEDYKLEDPLDYSVVVALLRPYLMGYLPAHQGRTSSHKH
ncbi:hypothetical protein B9Z19DRAFT_1128766 [Tuber borchii]|uniref:Uncharacterized protein n=1 Tax=Tuber borchii TaxID=42251 RepID=A0A2T6ZNL2_TUBBO|nr:hypothetical protein B9Z19DRAFT_1128766 [Tuber borchii]